MKLQSFLTACLLALFSLSLTAQENNYITLKLWPDGAPDSNGLSGEERVMPGGRNLLFDMYPDDEQVYYYCNEEHVTPDCPPAFIVHCEDDPSVPVSDSQTYAQKLEENGVPVTLLIYPDGGHGWGFKDSFVHKEEWTSALAEWLKAL